MKPISVHVDEHSYRDLRLLAERTGRAVAELIRDAMAEYLDRHRGSAGSMMDIPPHSSGAQLAGWSRSELLDEMLER
jgi:hypothetical protein